jgi:hypothetical protein
MPTGNEFSTITIPPYPLNLYSGQIDINANTAINLTTHPNSLLGLNATNGATLAITLPNVAAAVGMRYRLYMKTPIDTAGSIVTVTAGGQLMRGVILVDNQAVDIDPAASRLLTFIRNCPVGSYAEFISDGVNWQVTAATTLANGITVVV